MATAIAIVTKKNSMSKNTGSGTVMSDPLKQNRSKEGESVRNYNSNPDAPTLKNGKQFKGAYGG